MSKYRDSRKGTAMTLTAAQLDEIEGRAKKYSDEEYMRLSPKIVHKLCQLAREGMAAAKSATERAHSYDAIDQCPVCKGQGIVIVDYGDGPGFDTCYRCGGAGK